MKIENIAVFPLFEKLKLSHKDIIDTFVKQFLPYSDYSFIGLYSWNIKDACIISNLNDNLIIMENCYDFNGYFMSFIGNEISNDDLVSLIVKSKEFGCDGKLKMIPEHMITEGIVDNFLVSEDEDNNDYILSVTDIIEYNGRKLRNKRNQLNRFIKENENISINYLSLKSKETFDICETFLCTCHNHTSDFFEDEKTIIRRCLDCEVAPVKILTILSDGVIVSICIYEIVSDYIIIHFEKFNTDYEGVNAYSKFKLGEIALDNYCNYINWGPDLGIESLRNAKKQYCPIKFLKKYIIQEKILNN